APLWRGRLVHRHVSVNRARSRGQRIAGVVARLARHFGHASLVCRWGSDGCRVASERQTDSGRDSSSTRANGGTKKMTYTPLDPKRAAILLADLQAGIIELAATNDPARVRRGVSALAKLAQLFDIPTIVTTAPSEGGVHVTPEIIATLGDLPLHTRNTTDAFT